MIRTKDELLNSIKERFTDDTSDETISLLEDITDTISDFETRATDTTDWKTKYEENDNEWRQKYRDRFFNASDEDDEEDEPPKTVKTFEDLFKKVEG